MKIRLEKVEDHEAIDVLLRQAFTGNENELVMKIRASSDWIPELTFVAETEGKVVGHIMASRCVLDDIPMIALAPLAVLPAYQSQGIGHLLVDEMIEQAKHRVEPGIIVLGHPAYYAKFGFEVASQYGVAAPFDCPEEAYRVKWTGKTRLSGVVSYNSAFD
ncbi:GNAT family N-acetyltransferase [Exiguobacterium algae]|uniref:GNAT family N-acetyltransferase n=1 Tax=Exiguobacterium algae TaxID=2751250 RepID=UPI001BE8518D|nr:N-acetyltransferase [Exiguobacterium algae]